MAFCITICIYRLLNCILFKSGNSREAFCITTLNNLLDSTIPIVRLSKFLAKFGSALEAPYIAC